MLAVATSGFFLSLSLIVAIGAQNAFVLRQGLRGEHVFAVCLVCALSDAFLIMVGVSALTTAQKLLPSLGAFLKYGGALFLLAYAAKSLLSAWRGGGHLDPASGAKTSLTKALLILLSLTFLNPHVYLDTVILIGSVATRYPGQEAIFGAGACFGSLVFFFSLGYGARLLRPLFAKEISWRVLDFLIALVMAILAYGILTSATA